MPSPRASSSFHPTPASNEGRRPLLYTTRMSSGCFRHSPVGHAPAWRKCRLFSRQLSGCRPGVVEVLRTARLWKSEETKKPPTDKLPPRGAEDPGDGLAAHCSPRANSDFDECSTTDFCSDHALCVNTYGSYYCQCQAGFRNNNKKVTFTFTESHCIDINECIEQLGLCGPNANCTNTIGNYSCSCQPGFTSKSGQQTFRANESSCQDINECIEQRGLCGPNATCRNTIGNYSCSCQPGFTSKSGQQTFRANESSCQGNASLINTSLCQEGIGSR
ncbi:AGRE1 protein, partial [Polypterus senegalus]